jgi:hypothetical protein
MSSPPCLGHWLFKAQVSLTAASVLATAALSTAGAAPLTYVPLLAWLAGYWMPPPWYWLPPEDDVDSVASVNQGVGSAPPEVKEKSA